MIRALLFDAAGTLFEPAEPVAVTYARFFGRFGWNVGTDRVASAFGRVFRSRELPEYASHPDGDGAEREWWRDVVRETMEACGIDARAEPDRASGCFQLLFDHYAAAAAWRVFPEVPGVMARARREGFRTAVVSNFDRRLHGILAGAGLDFGFVLTSADARARKPDPSIFHQALERLEMPADEVMHVGDSAAADGAGARAAGIVPFLLERPRTDLRDFLAEAVGRCRK